MRLLVAAALSLPSAACSFSYRLDSLFGKDKDDQEYTSATPTAVQTRVGQSADALNEADLAIAKAAAAEAVNRKGKDVSVPWENPATGARGTVTPLAAAYSQNGATCRDFLASYVRDTTEAWLEGEACRMDGGGWEVRNLKPWKRS